MMMAEEISREKGLNILLGSPYKQSFFFLFNHWLSNFSIYELHLEGLIKQVAGHHSQSLLQ